MPIKSVFGKYSKGLQRRKQTADITGMIRSADIIVAQSTNEFGDVSLEGYNSAIGFLSSAQNDPRVALKMLQFQNLGLQLQDSINSAIGDVTFFQELIEDELDQAGEIFKDDPRNLILATSDIYSRASTNYIGDELPRILSKFSAGQKIPNEVFDYSDNLEKVTIQYLNVANSYVNPTVEGQVGPEAPEGFGFFVDSNPSTGQITGIRFMPVNSLNPAPKGYNKTDSFLDGTKHPIWLPTMQSGNQIISRLGDRLFKRKREGATSPDEVATLILNQQNVGFGLIGEFFETKKERNINLKEFGFNPLNVPTAAVLRDGSGSLLYLDSKNILHDVEDEDALRKWLDTSNRNGQEEIDKAYRVSRAFLSDRIVAGVGDPYGPDISAGITKGLGGGALSFPTVPRVAGQEPSGSLPAITGAPTPPRIIEGGRTQRFGTEVAKGVAETEQQILGGAQQFFGKIKEGRIFNP